MIELTFRNPEYLWLLLTIPVVIIMHFYLMRHSKQKAMKFANFETLRRVTGEKLITKNLWVLTLRVFLVLFVILAVSGSILWYTGQSNNNNFVIAIDTSASMSAKDIPPTRIESAKLQAKNFLENLQTESEIGLVTFSGVTFINKPLTKNKQEIIDEINKIDIVQAGGTDIPGAIITSANLLSTSKKGRMMILMSDGSSTVGTFLDQSIRQSIEYAQNNHMIINTIGTGTSTEQPIGYIPEYYNITSVYNEDTLIRISNQTGGKYYQGSNNEQIIKAFEAISEDANTALLSFDLNPIFMIIATILLFIECGMINTRFKKIP